MVILSSRLGWCVLVFYTSLYPFYPLLIDELVHLEREVNYLLQPHVNCLVTVNRYVPETLLDGKTGQL